MCGFELCLWVMRPASVARWELLRSAAGGRGRSVSISAAVKKQASNCAVFWIQQGGTLGDNPEVVWFKSRPRNHNRTVILIQSCGSVFLPKKPYIKGFFKKENFRCGFKCIFMG